MDRDPKILKIDGRDELVVMTMADYRRLREAAEDAHDVRTMRTARKADRGKPTYSIEEARWRLGLKKRVSKGRGTSARRRAS